MKLQLQLGVQLLRRADFLLIDTLGPRLEAAEADLGAANIAAVEPQAALCQARQEGAVVADDDECALETLQPVLQPVDRAEIEVIGRLVEQKHIRVLRQRTDDRCPPPLAAARRRSGARQVDPDLVGDCGRLMRCRSIGPGKHPFLQRRMIGHDRILLQQDNSSSGHDLAFALIRLDQVGEAFEQRRLARAVASDQGQPVARADVNVEVPEQPSLALHQAKVFIR